MFSGPFCNKNINIQKIYLEREILMHCTYNTSGFMDMEKEGLSNLETAKPW